MLESTIVCVDNSEFSRNGDFTPSRLGAQQDVLQTISRTKMRQNPENNVGLLAIGGSKPRLVNTLTPDTNNLLTGFASIKHDGAHNNFSTSLRIAHLALKHRISKNYRQRIVILVCSPLQETEQELVKLAKKLKKENVNVDIVNFGEDEMNVERLAKFVETLNGKNTDPQCNLVNVPAGGNLNDGVRMSRICGQEANAGAGGAGGMEDAGGQDWMDDPNMDPDLALALRVSLEESRARQQQEAQASQPNVPSAIREENASQADADATTTVQNNDEAINAMDNDDEMLMQALQMSLAGGEAENADGNEEESVAEEEQEEEIDYANMTEEQQIEFALKMSLQQDNENNDDDDMKE